MVSFSFKRFVVQPGERETNSLMIIIIKNRSTMRIGYYAWASYLVDAKTMGWPLPNPLSPESLLLVPLPMVIEELAWDNAKNDGVGAVGHIELCPTLPLGWGQSFLKWLVWSHPKHAPVASAKDETINNFHH